MANGVDVENLRPAVGHGGRLNPSSDPVVGDGAGADSPGNPAVIVADAGIAEVRSGYTPGRGVRAPAADRPVRHALLARTEGATPFAAAVRPEAVAPIDDDEVTLQSVVDRIPEKFKTLFKLARLFDEETLKAPEGQVVTNLCLIDYYKAYQHIPAGKRISFSAMETHLREVVTSSAAVAKRHPEFLPLQDPLRIRAFGLLINGDAKGVWAIRKFLDKILTSDKLAVLTDRLKTAEKIRDDLLHNISLTKGLIDDKRDFLNTAVRQFSPFPDPTGQKSRDYVLESLEEKIRTHQGDLATQMESLAWSDKTILELKRSIVEAQHAILRNSPIPADTLRVYLASLADQPDLVPESLKGQVRKARGELASAAPEGSFDRNYFGNRPVKALDIAVGTFNDLDHGLIKAILVFEELEQLPSYKNLPAPRMAEDYFGLPVAMIPEVIRNTPRGAFVPVFIGEGDEQAGDLKYWRLARRLPSGGLEIQELIPVGKEASAHFTRVEVTQLSPKEIIGLKEKGRMAEENIVRALRANRDVEALTGIGGKILEQLAPLEHYFKMGEQAIRSGSFVDMMKRDARALLDLFESERENIERHREGVRQTLYLVQGLRQEHLPEELRGQVAELEKMLEMFTNLFDQREIEKLCSAILSEEYLDNGFEKWVSVNGVVSFCAIAGGVAAAVLAGRRFGGFFNVWAERLSNWGTRLMFGPLDDDTLYALRPYATLAMTFAATRFVSAGFMGLGQVAGTEFGKFASGALFDTDMASNFQLYQRGLISKEDLLKGYAQEWGMSTTQTALYMIAGGAVGAGAKRLSVSRIKPLRDIGKTVVKAGGWMNRSFDELWAGTNPVSSFFRELFDEVGEEFVEAAAGAVDKRLGFLATMLNCMDGRNVANNFHPSSGVTLNHQTADPNDGVVVHLDYEAGQIERLKRDFEQAYENMEHPIAEVRENGTVVVKVRIKEKGKWQFVTHVYHPTTEPASLRRLVSGLNGDVFGKSYADKLKELGLKQSQETIPSPSTGDAVVSLSNQGQGEGGAISLYELLPNADVAKTVKKLREMGVVFVTDPATETNELVCRLGKDTIFIKLPKASEKGVDAARSTNAAPVMAQATIDLYPELDIHPGMPEAEVVSKLRDFLVRHREAQKRFFGRELTHCGDSSRLVSQLLRAKGFVSFTIPTEKAVFYQDDAPEREALYARAAQDFVFQLGISRYGWERLVGALEKVTDPGELEGKLKEMAEAAGIEDLTIEKLRWAYQKYQTLSPREVALLKESHGGWGHTVAAVKIGDRYYVIDANQEQFGGDRFDQLVFVPVEEAHRHGMILSRPLTDGQGDKRIGVDDAYLKSIESFQQQVAGFMKSDIPALERELEAEVEKARDEVDRVDQELDRISSLSVEERVARVPGVRAEVEGIKKMVDEELGPLEREAARPAATNEDRRLYDEKRRELRTRATSSPEAKDELTARLAYSAERVAEAREKSDPTPENILRARAAHEIASAGSVSYDAMLERTAKLSPLAHRLLADSINRPELRARMVRAGATYRLGHWDTMIARGLLPNEFEFVVAATFFELLKEMQESPDPTKRAQARAEMVEVMGLVEKARQEGIVFSEVEKYKGEALDPARRWPVNQGLVGIPLLAGVATLLGVVGAQPDATHAALAGAAVLAGLGAVAGVWSSVRGLLGSKPKTPLDVETVTIHPGKEKVPTLRFVAVEAKKGNEAATRHFVVAGKKGFVFGREGISDLRVDDRGISKQHFKVERVGNGWVIEDMGSANGTYVNGKKLPTPSLKDPSPKPTVLKEGDTITVAGFTWVFTEEFDGLSEILTPEQVHFLRDQGISDLATSSIMILYQLLQLEGGAIAHQGIGPQVVKALAQSALQGEGGMTELGRALKKDLVAAGFNADGSLPATRPPTPSPESGRSRRVVSALTNELRGSVLWPEIEAACRKMGKDPSSLTDEDVPALVQAVSNEVASQFAMEVNKEPVSMDFTVYQRAIKTLQLLGMLKEQHGLNLLVSDKGLQWLFNQWSRVLVDLMGRPEMRDPMMIVQRPELAQMVEDLRALFHWALSSRESVGFDESFYRDLQRRITPDRSTPAAPPPAQPTAAVADAETTQHDPVRVLADWQPSLPATTVRDDTTDAVSTVGVSQTLTDVTPDRGIIRMVWRAATRIFGGFAMTTDAGHGYKEDRPIENRNEDAVGYAYDKDGNLWMIVVDGMGGHGDGDKASLIAIHQFTETLRETGDVDKAYSAAETAVKEFNADRLARATPEERRRGKIGRADAVVVLTKIEKPTAERPQAVAKFYFRGDSKAMILRRNPATGGWIWVYRTVEQTHAKAKKKAEKAAEAVAWSPSDTIVIRDDRFGNIVANHLVGGETKGTQDGEIANPDDPSVMRDALGFETGVLLAEGDLVILGSDGLWENFRKHEFVLEIIRDCKTPEEVVQVLRDEAHLRMEMRKTAKDIISDSYFYDEATHREGYRTERVGFVYRGKYKPFFGKTIYVDGSGKVYLSPDAKEHVDTFKNDNVSVVAYLHEPAKATPPPAPSTAPSGGSGTAKGFSTTTDPERTVVDSDPETTIVDRGPPTAHSAPSSSRPARGRPTLTGIPALGSGHAAQSTQPTTRPPRPTRQMGTPQPSSSTRPAVTVRPVVVVGSGRPVVTRGRRAPGGGVLSAVSSIGFFTLHFQRRATVKILDEVAPAGSPLRTSFNKVLERRGLKPDSFTGDDLVSVLNDLVGETKPESEEARTLERFLARLEAARIIRIEKPTPELIRSPLSADDIEPYLGLGIFSGYDFTQSIDHPHSHDLFLFPEDLTNLSDLMDAVLDTNVQTSLYLAQLNADAKIIVVVREGEIAPEEEALLQWFADQSRHPVVLYSETRFIREYPTHAPIMVGRDQPRQGTRVDLEITERLADQMRPGLPLVIVSLPRVGKTTLAEGVSDKVGNPRTTARTSIDLRNSRHHANLETFLRKELARIAYHIQKTSGAEPFSPDSAGSSASLLEAFDEWLGSQGLTASIIFDEAVQGSAYRELGPKLKSLKNIYSIIILHRSPEVNAELEKTFPEGSAVVHHLGLLGKEDARTLLSSLAGRSEKVSQSAIDRLYELSGGHIPTLERLYYLWSRAGLVENHTQEAESGFAATEGYSSELEAIKESLAKDLIRPDDFSETEKRLLAGIASGRQLRAADCDREALDALTSIGLIRINEAGLVEISGTLIRDAISAVFEAEQIILVERTQEQEQSIQAERRLPSERDVPLQEGDIARCREWFAKQGPEAEDLFNKLLANIRHIDRDQFQTGLRNVEREITRFVGDKPYYVVVDDAGRSGNFMASSLRLARRPERILTVQDILFGRLDMDPSYPIVVLDDASYSGHRIEEIVRGINQKFPLNGANTLVATVAMTTIARNHIASSTGPENIYSYFEVPTLSEILSPEEQRLLRRLSRRYASFAAVSYSPDSTILTFLYYTVPDNFVRLLDRRNNLPTTPVDLMTPYLVDGTEEGPIRRNYGGPKKGR